MLERVYAELRPLAGQSVGVRASPRKTAPVPVRASAASVEEAGATRAVASSRS